MLIRSIDVGTVNLALCDFRSDDSKIIRWEVLNVPTIRSLFAAMDARPFEGHVVIERQSKKSVKMMAVQHYLEAYYVLKALPVTIFSAKHKLKGTGHENTGKTLYRQRKKASIMLTTTWLHDHPQDPAIHHAFTHTKKKDDYSDAALMALAFARHPVKTEGVEIPPQKIVCRKPTLTQQKTGRYTQSNLKHIIVKDWKCENEQALKERLSSDKKLAKAVQKQFKTTTGCWEMLFPAASSSGIPPVEAPAT